MTPQEKAIELYTKYDNLCRDFTKGVSIKEMAKESALITVDEIVKNGIYSFEDNRYWEQVKQEIKKL